jgi:hypothetical protein
MLVQAAVQMLEMRLKREDKGDKMASWQREVQAHADKGLVPAVEGGSSKGDSRSGTVAKSSDKKRSFSEVHSPAQGREPSQPLRRSPRSAARVMSPSDKMDEG